MWGNSNMTRCFKRHWVNSGDNGLGVYSIGLKNCEKKSQSLISTTQVFINFSLKFLILFLGIPENGRPEFYKLKFASFVNKLCS